MYVMMRLKWFMSIQNTMILSFMVLISIIVLLLSIASYKYTVNDFENLSINNTALLLSEINFNIDTYIDNMKSIAQVVAKNEDITSLMSFYERNGERLSEEDITPELDMLRSRASRHMSVVAGTRGDITNIAVISKYGDVVLSDLNKKVNVYSQYADSDWFLKPLMNKDDFFVSPSHVQNFVDNEYNWVISISKALTDPETGQVSGVMLVDLNYRAIESICENANLEQTGYIYLMDSQKNLIYHPQQQLVYSGIKSEDYNAVLNMPQGNNHVRAETEGKLYIKNISDTTDWIAVGVINLQNLIPNRASIIRFYIMLAYLAIVSSGIVAVIISQAITKPIKTLENTMRRVEDGDLTVSSDIKLHNEIGHLSNTFNAMVQQISRLMDDLVRKESEKRQSEIKALQAQINPHFLYNTLDTIIWMSASGKNKEVVEVTSALAHLFRTSVSQGGSVVELEVEMKNIESYLTIQKLRYLDKLSYRIQVAPETKMFMTPKLILQPLVENAVYHGIKPSENGGEIIISSELSEGNLLITVEDTGVGMAAGEKAELLEPPVGDSGHIGILNVHNRIKLVFGAEYGLVYQSAKGEGTRVTIRLPAVRREDVPDA